MVRHRIAISADVVRQAPSLPPHEELRPSQALCRPSWSSCAFKCHFQLANIPQYDWDNEELLELLSKLVALGELRLSR